MACPIKWDSELEEPYICFPSFPMLRLTPFRKGDDDQLIKHWNEPMIGSWARNRAFPYLPEHMQVIWDKQYPGQKRIGEELRVILNELANHSHSAARIPDLTLWPFSVIRTNTGEVAGDVGTWCIRTTTTIPDVAGQCPEGQKLNDINHPAEPDQAAMVGENAAEIFEVGYNIAPEWRGKGLASEAVGLVQDWARWMEIGRLIAHTELTNLGSQAVLRKKGFQEKKREMVQWPQDKGGEIKELMVWEYVL